MTTIPSPLAFFLRHLQSSTPSASEVMLFTFNHDLGFFERAALGAIEGLGARVTIVADARMAHHDLFAVHRAGIAYLPGLASCSGAFHPKLLVIAEAGRASVAIGSGNLSLAGWQGNDELWTVHSATVTEGSAVVSETGAWLRELAAYVTLSEGVEAACSRVADILEPLAATEPGARLIHSLATPLLEQLPTGPVDRLCVYAPFHDAGARALAALIDRLKPTAVTVAVQEKLNRIDGPAVDALLKDIGDVVWLADNPYRHGKLIEWHVDNRIFTLTGSPNISSAALLQTVKQGGNVEIGVIAEANESLLPAGKPAGASLASVKFLKRTEERTSGVVLLSAVRTRDGLSLRTAAPLSEPSSIEMSFPGSPPDAWDVVGSMAAGTSEASVGCDTASGARIRLKSSADVSNVTFVIDLERVLRTRSSPARSRIPDLDSVLTDPSAAELFARLVEEMRTVDRPGNRPGREGSRPAAESAPFKIEDWQAYLDRCEGQLGARAVAFAFGLALPRLRSGFEVAVEDWDEELPEDEAGGLDDDQAEDVEVPPESPELALRNANDAAKRRYRDVAMKLIDRVPDAEPHERLLALRIALVVVAGDGWPGTTWTELILRGVERLDVDLVADDYESAAGSLAALSLCIVRSAEKTFDSGIAQIRFAHAADRVGHLLVAATDEKVRNYAEGLRARFPGATADGAVLQLRDLLVNEDWVGEAANSLRDRGFPVERSGRVIDLVRPVPEPRLVAFEGLIAAERAGVVAIRARGTSGWVTVVWRRPDLIVIESGKKHGTHFSNHYRYDTLSSPSTDIRNPEFGRPDPRRRVGYSLAGQPLIPTAVEMLQAVGLSGPSPFER